MLGDPKYADNIIKEYEYWTLFLHERQNPYVGKCYAWWKDRTANEGNGLSLSFIPTEALTECFQRIVPDVLRAAQRGLGYNVVEYGRSFLLNQACLCNEVATHHGHLHVHFIPRYRDTTFIKPLQRSFTDELWGKHYGPMNTQQKLIPGEHEAVRRAMMDTID